MKKVKSQQFTIIVGWVIAVCVLAVVAVIKFYPKYDKVLDSLMTFSVKANITSGEIEYIKNRLTFSSFIDDDFENPLTEAPVKKSDDITQTDSDVLEKINKARRIKQTTKRKRGGKVIDRTYKNVANTISYQNVVVQNRTHKKVNIKSILENGANLSIKNKEEPTVLIYHSHTCESYLTLDENYWYKGFTARSEDSSENVVRVGTAICEQLEKAGINVIHDTSIYDSDYPNAYKTAGKGIDKILKKYPSIKIAIDIHRDAVDSGNVKYKPVTEIAGKRAAQLMIITGCEEDYITDFPNWKENLKFALCLQQKCESMYPTLMRPVYFADRRYNMYKLYNSVLIEMGSDGNTLEQAVYSGKMLGNALASLIGDYVEENE